MGCQQYRRPVPTKCSPPSAAPNTADIIPRVACTALRPQEYFLWYAGILNWLLPLMNCSSWVFWASMLVSCGEWWIDGKGNSVASPLISTLPKVQEMRTKNLCIASQGIFSWQVCCPQPYKDTHLHTR